jgi:putative DNA primase/helicase
VPHKSLLVVQFHESHPTHVAALHGARMLVAPETDHDDRLNEALVKTLTGGDRLEARRMREDPWHFEPSWTAFMHTNHRPSIRGTDEATWRRLRVIPWDVTIPVEQRDQHLRDRLTDEAPGILRWIVDGARTWLADGLAEPDRVNEATAAYREDQDHVGRFLAECCRTGQGRYVFVDDLRRRYEEWCRAEGEDPFTPQAMGAELRRRGFERKGGGRRRWLGLALIAEETTEP